MPPPPSPTFGHSSDDAVRFAVNTDQCCQLPRLPRAGDAGVGDQTEVFAGAVIVHRQNAEFAGYAEGAMAENGWWGLRRRRIVAGDLACQNFDKARYAMTETTTIPPFHQPGSITDPLTGIARDGARQRLAAAIKAEAANFGAFFGDALLPDGRQRIVRHGTGLERMIQTGIGPIPV